MTILYFYQYFSTPKGSWGTRVYEFAKKWVEQGHKVVVVTTVYSKSDLKAKSFLETQIIDGIEVKIINLKIDNKQSFAKRLLGFLSYALLSSYYALSIKCDVVIASSGPIFVSIPGLLAKWLRRKKLVFEVRDLWPQGVIELGIIKNKLLIRLAYWIERTAYKNSDLIVTLSPGMSENIDYRFAFGNKCISIPNAVNLNLFSPLTSIKSGMKFKEFSYAIYTGNIGEVNNSMWLLNAARELKSRNIQDLKILIIGDGQQKEIIKNIKEQEDIGSLLILDLIPKNDLIPLIQNALVSLVPLKGTPILATSSPNKFFESLGAGVPVIQNTTGWMSVFLDTHNVGVTIDPNDYISLVNHLILFKEMSPEKKNEYRIRCLEVANLFDKNVLAQKMITAINQIS